MLSSKNIIKWFFKYLLTGIGIAMVVFGTIFLVAAFQCNTKLKEMKQPLIQIPIDLSKPGQYTTTLPTVENYFHGLILMIEAKQQFSDINTLEEFAEELRGHAIIQREDGRVVGKIDLSVCCPAFWQKPPETICFVVLETFPEYEGQNSQLLVTITQGAAKLDGIKQTLIARYNLCGLESTLVFISTAVGIALTLGGLGITVPMSIHIIRKFRKKRTLTEESKV